jgi:PKD repeat protein
MVNPDGRVSMSRYNNNGVDCNRDNGYMWNNEGNSSGAFSQVETKALRNCILENQFVVYTNYHSGTEILSYPWSYRATAPRDLAHINQMAGVYASASGYTNLAYGQGFNIMYAINGSTKDFQYGSLGNIGWSMEISNLKQPPASQISYYYEANKPSMLQMISQCGLGISGMVTDSVTGLPVQASVWISNYFPVYNDPVTGDYHKYILPGTYTVRVMANGYQPKTLSNVVVPAQGTAVADWQLTPSTGYYSHKVMSCRIPGNNFGDEGYTPGALGKPDSVPYALGKNGWIVLDLGDTLFNGTGTDFTVIQSGTLNKSFSVSGGHNMDGPFTLIGTGNGTTGFDLSSVSIPSLRYLYIKDNGTGPASGVGAGFNLDAVEVHSIPVMADFTSTSATLCQGGTVDFTDLSAGNPDNWAWSFPGGTPSSSTLQNPAGIRYDTPGQYDVSLSVSNSFSSGSKTLTGYIQVYTMPAVSLGNDTAVCAWNIVTLDAGNPGCTYLWSTGATTQAIQADSAGVGYGAQAYWVNVTSQDGCQSADSITVDFQNCTTLPEVTNQPFLRLSPNPASNAVTVEASRLYQVTIFTPDGRPVLSRQMHRLLETYDLSSLAPGIYLVRFSIDKQSQTRKLIITR